MTQIPETPLVISMGDPAGCGPLITCAAWQALHAAKNARPFCVLAPPHLYSDHVPVEVIAAPAEAADCFTRALPVLPLDVDLPTVTTGEPVIAAADAILASISAGVALCQSGSAAGLVTNPINKALLYEAGFTHPGHTEYLAQLCTETKVRAPIKPIMMLVGGGLRVALATIHLPLIEAARAISEDLLSEVAMITHHALQQDFGRETPRLVFTGLNPHAGEGGALGREEIEIINPAAAKLRTTGIDISDARPADTVFHEALSGAYDGVIAMTHDQGLIPVKTLDFWGGVNVTLGLPIIRTSPDHGTAYDAAAAGNVRADSLIAAVLLAGEMAQNRARANA